MCVADCVVSVVAVVYFVAYGGLCIVDGPIFVVAGVVCIVVVVVVVADKLVRAADVVYLVVDDGVFVADVCILGEFRISFASSFFFYRAGLIRVHLTVIKKCLKHNTVNRSIAFTFFWLELPLRKAG